MTKIKHLPKILWWVVVAVCVIAAAVCLAVRAARPVGGSAEIRYDGVLVRTVSLKQDQSFVLEQDPTVRFEVKDGAIRFVDATCPDKICERAGALSKTGATAACLPRKTSVTVVSGEKEGDTDAIAG